MKLLFAFVIIFNLQAANWSVNFEETQKIAKTSHQNILVSFSGSDWCVPCIRLKQDIFDSEVFKKYASNILLVRADFPRLKKNKLSPEQVKLNEALAERYNKNGKFPYTVLVDENGKILKAWDGYPELAATQFVAQVAAFSK